MAHRRPSQKHSARPSRLLMALLRRAYQGLGAWWNRLRQAWRQWHEESDSRAPLRIEALEPRLLMSADWAPTNGHPHFSVEAREATQAEYRSADADIGTSPGATVRTQSSPATRSVTAEVTGPGTATLTQQDGRYSLTLSGTSTLTQVKLHVSDSTDPISLAAIQADAAVGSLDIRGTTLDGTAHFGQGLAQLLADGIQHSHITVGGADSFKLLAATLHDTTLSAPDADVTVQAQQWSATTAHASLLEVAVLKSLSVSGQFAADLSVTRASAPMALQSVQIGGEASGRWVVAGRANSVQVGSTSAGWHASFASSLALFATQRDASGLLAAGSLQLLQVGGSMRQMTVWAGANLGGDAQLGGSGSATDSFRPGLLARVRVTGDVLDSRILSSLDPQDSVLFNGDDTTLGGIGQRIQEFTVGGQLTGATYIVAPGWPATVRIGGQAVPSAGIPNFSVTPPALPQLTLALALRSDSGSSSTDRITRDPTISGTIGQASQLSALTALLDPGADGRDPVDIRARLQPDGSFTLERDQLDRLARQGLLTPGAHSLHVTATDLAGRRVQAQLSFTWLEAAPAVSVALQADTGTSAADGVTQNSAVTGLVGLGNLPAGTRLLATLDSGATPTYSDITNALQPDGRFMLSAAEMNRLAGRSLGDGPVTLRLRTTDAAGNIRDLAFSFTLDVGAPTLAATLRADTGSSRTDGLTRDATIDGRLGPVGDAISLRVSLDGRDPVELIALVQPDGRFTLSRETLDGLASGSLTQGAHTLTLQAVDAAGNAASAALAFNLDTQAPQSRASADISPVDRLGGDASRTDAARVILTGHGEAGSTVRLVGQGLSTVVAADGSFTLADVSLELGDNALRLVFSDAAGNEYTLERTLTRAAMAARDPVLDWINIGLASIQRDATDPPLAMRVMAMQSIAVYDALAAIQGTPAYLVGFAAEPGSSADAAAAAAAHRVISALYPAQRALLDAALANSLAAIPDGTGKTAGIALGRSMADQILALRAKDGALVLRDYRGDASALGVWRPTSPLYLSADQPDWGAVEPFALTAGDQFRAPAPYALDSADYARQLEEVRLLGAANSTQRTADQTQQALFWADGAGSTTPPGHWNEIAAQIAQAQGLGTAASARLFAQLNVALADAAIAAWDTKYTYNTWRPVDAIHEADRDGNPATQVDPDWRPLLITPPHPDYVSGHSTFSAAAATVLIATFGDNVAFSTTSATLPGVTRSFTSFTQAAEEAGKSRIYGGIHTQGANDAGKAIGTQVAGVVLARFNQTQDQTAPKVVLDIPAAATRTNVQLQGQVVDNLSGVAAVEVRLDGGAWEPLTLDDQGRFTVSTAFALDQSQDGRHRIEVRARDTAGNVSAATRRELLLDTQAPAVTLAGLADGSTLTADSRLSGQIASASAVVSLSVSLNGGVARPVHFDPATGRFEDALVLKDLGVGPVQLSLQATDAAGNVTTITRQLNLAALPRFGVARVTPSEGSVDTALTFRPQVFFSRAVDPATLNVDTFYATGPDGQRLQTTLVPAQDGSFVWMFFAQPLPGSARITLHLDGNAIRAQADGTALDADGDGRAGGVLSWSFTTVSTAPVAGTRLVGKLVDPGPDLLPMTFDDIRRGPDGVIHTPDDVFLRPIAGVTVAVIGRPDLTAVTDANGDFAFDNLPAGDLKIRIDGRTATNAPGGTFFPEMVMDVQLQPGRTNTLMGTMGSPQSRHENLDRVEVYLPRVRTAALQPVSATQPTTITVLPEAAPNLSDEQRARMSVTTAPGSAVGADGQVLQHVQMGINVIPFELIKDMLPPGLAQNATFITIQAPGVETFTTPLAITMPNTSGAAPGSKLSVLSFDHTTGLIVQTGTATVSADGLSVTSDPGSGILAPGWHGFGGGGLLEPERPAVPANNAGTPTAVMTGLDHDRLFFSDDSKFSFRVENTSTGSATMLVKYFLEGNRGDQQFIYFIDPYSPTFRLAPGEAKDVEMGFINALDIVDEIALYGARLKVQTFAVDANGSAVGAPVTEKSIAIYRLVDAVDADRQDATITLPATLRGEDQLVAFSFRMPEGLKPEFGFFEMNDAGRATDTTELVLIEDAAEGTAYLKLQPAAPASHADDGKRSGLWNYQVELSSSDGGTAFGAFTVNGLVVRPTEIRLNFEDFAAGIREELLLANESSGLYVAFDKFLDDHQAHRQLTIGAQFDLFIKEFYDVFLAELSEAGENLYARVVDDVDLNAVNQNSDVIKLIFDRDRPAISTFDKKVFESYVGQGGKLADADAVMRGLTRNYAPGAFKAVEELGIDSWNSLRFADTILPDRFPMLSEYAKFLVAEFASEIGVLRGLEYRGGYDALGSPIPSASLMAIQRLNPFDRIAPGEQEENLIVARSGGPSYAINDRVAYYKAWGDSRDAQRVFFVEGLDDDVIFRDASLSPEMLKFSIRNAASDTAAPIWVRLQLTGNQDIQKFLMEVPQSVSIAAGETRNFSVNLLEDLGIVDVVALYGARLQISVAASPDGEAIYSKEVSLYCVANGVDFTSFDSDITMPLTNTAESVPGSEAQLIYLMDEDMIPDVDFKRAYGTWLEDTEEIYITERDGSSYIVFEPGSTGQSGYSDDYLIRLFDPETGEKFGNLIVSGYIVRPTLVLVQRDSFDRAVDTFLQTGGVEDTAGFRQEMARFLSLPENSDIPDTPEARLAAFKNALFEIYFSSLKKVFEGLPEINFKWIDEPPDVEFVNDRIFLTFDEDRPNSNDFNFEKFALGLGRFGLASDYEALGRGLTDGYRREAYPENVQLGSELGDDIIAADTAAERQGWVSIEGYAHTLAQASARLVARGYLPQTAQSDGIFGDWRLTQPTLSSMERWVVQARNGTLVDEDQREAVINHFVSLMPDTLRNPEGAAGAATSGLAGQATSAAQARHTLGILQVAAAPLTRANETPAPVTQVDLGSTVADGAGGALASRTVYLGNSGTGDLTIRSVRFVGEANGFTATLTSGSTVLGAPQHSGGSSTYSSLGLQLGFDPSVAGSASAVVEIVADTGQGSVVRRIALQGSSRASTGVLEIDKLGVNLGGQAVGAAASVMQGAITLHNPGAAPLSITELSLPEGSGFSLVGLPAGGVSPASPLVIAAGQTLKLDAAFAPGKLGLQRAVLTVRSSDPAHPVQTVMLSGTGTVASGIDASAHYGRDRVGVKQDGQVIGNFTSDDAGGWGAIMAPFTSRVDASVFDPVSGLVAHTTSAAGRLPQDRLRLTPFGASTAPDSDGDGLSDDIEFALGTNPQRRDSDRNGVDDFDQFQQQNQSRTDIAASPGDTITVQVPFDANTAQATFSVFVNGSRTTVDVVATSVDAASGTARFLIPDNAQTGDMTVFGQSGGARVELPFTLQVMPKLTGIQVLSIDPDGRSALVVLTGVGLVDNATTYHFGSTAVVDDRPSSTPVEGPVMRGNQVTMIVPLSEGVFGSIRATTAAGTSVNLSAQLTSISARALSGTPANANAASANAGQAITVNGTGLSLQSGFILRWTDSGGALRYSLLQPSSVNPEGTQAVVTVPAHANGAFGLHMLGTANQPLLQIVPTLQVVSDGDTALTLRGSGLVEGASHYAIGGSTVDDTATYGSVDVQVGSNGVHNTQARLDAATLARRGFGQANITTAGGTSNSVALNTLRPATDTARVGPLRDLSIDTASGHLWMSDTASPGHLLRVDPSDGRVLQTLTLPSEAGSPSGDTAVQVLTQAISLAETPVPAGSLLVFNGASSPDRVLALEPGTGRVIASLSLANYNLTAAAFDATSGHLWVADTRGAGTRLVQLDPNTASELAAITLPIGLATHAALAFHPTTGNLWIGANVLGSQVMEIARDGRVLRQVDLGVQGLGDGNAVVGLAFDSDATLHAAGANGLVIRADLAKDANSVQRPTLSAVVAVAAQGTPARADTASSNAGQVVELQGTQFDASTRVVFEVRDNTGRIGQVAVKPLALNGDGTRLQVRVPEMATTGLVRVVNSGTTQLTGSGVADSRYRHVTVSFVATEATTVLRFADGGLDGAGQQSWGLDNVRITAGDTLVFEDDFETTPKDGWSERGVDTSAAGVLGRFSGRFNGGAGQSLTLRDLQPGQTYTLSFDVLVLDLWSNPDGVIRVTAGDQTLWRETFVNAANIGAEEAPVQTYGQSEALRLQIVPTLNSFTLGQASSGGPSYAITGSGFVPGASTLTVGGQTVAASVGSTAISIQTQLTVDGRLRITTEGGYAELPGVSTPATPLQARITGLAATAETGTPTNPAQPSANVGQVLRFTAVGNLGAIPPLVQFSATDDQGQPTSITVRAVSDPQTGGFTVAVPLAARTGVVRVLGTEFSTQLQVVPILRATSGAVVPGQVILIEGTGLAQQGASITIDGQPATVTEVRRVGVGSNLERELLSVRVPAGAQAGDVRVLTPGGTLQLLSSRAVPGADASHLSGITAVATQGTARVAGAASANANQVISLSGVALRADDQVVFTCMSAEGFAYEQTVTPTRVDVEAGRIAVTVPVDAVTGRVRLARDNAGVVLQVVPTVSTLAVGRFASEMVVVGSGFTEGAVAVSVGGRDYVDDSLDGFGLDVTNRRVTGGISFNSGITLSLSSGAPAGGIVVRTDGGSSATLARSATTLVGTATTGTPADPTLASAVPGQTVSVQGIGLDINTSLVFQVIDEQGVRREQLVRATSANLARTSVDFIVPDNAITGSVHVLGDASGQQFALQILPQVLYAQLQAIAPDGKSATVLIWGRGLIEGNDTEYRMGSERLFDASSRLGPDVVARETSDGLVANGQVTVTVPVRDGVVGDITVVTAGGASLAITPLPAG